MITVNNKVTTLPLLIDEIHDLYFSIDDILYVKDSKELRLFIGDFKREGLQKREFVPQFSLCVTQVLSYEIKDTEQIGFYDIDVLEYNENVLSVKTCVPLDFMISLGDHSHIYTSAISLFNAENSYCL